MATQLAHRIKGAAFIASLDDIGQLAEQLETVIHSSVPGYEIEAKRIWEQLHEGLDRLPSSSG